MLSVAVGWQVYALTSDPLALGIIGLVLFLPGAGFVMVTGHVADRFDRRLVVLLCHLTQIACSISLAVMTLSGIEDLWPIYTILFILGTANAFQGPASQAILPLLVPLEHFSNAVAWNSSIWQLAVILGPSLGGILYSLSGGAHVVYLSHALLDSLALLAIFALNLRTGRMETAAFSRETLTAGLNFIFRQKAILGTISLDLFAVLLGGAVALLPIYARDILHIGPAGLGVLRGAPGVGASLTSPGGRPSPSHAPCRPDHAVVCGGFRLVTIIFGISTHFLLSLACLFLLGAFDMVSVIVRHTLVQVLTPHSMQGRVAAVNLVFIGASNELGEFESGVTADWFGVIPAVVIGGIGTLLVVLAWSVLFPELRRVRRLEDIRPAEDDSPGPAG
ncbi:MAG: Enterobactin exporter EntS [Candidatus Hinthialibacteria bacterium OLB16]|nr:MAG: Enterobactin exporter EntS [Candidatus Hinthialibacteria bacterium OLB16]